MPHSLIRTDPRFWVLSEALASYAGDEDDPPIHEDDRLRAAVAVVIRARPTLDFLLIRRAESPRDPWSGHMALPGGRYDDTDGVLLETAKRETLEETGVDLSRFAAQLGRLDDVAPMSRRLPLLTVASFVFGVPADTAASVASAEVDAVLWVTLDALRDPANHGTVEIPLPGGPRDFPCFHVADAPVWGLTHRILSHFLERYPDSELERLRSG